MMSTSHSHTKKKKYKGIKTSNASRTHRHRPRATRTTGRLQVFLACFKPGTLPRGSLAPEREGGKDPPARVLPATLLRRASVVFKAIFQTAYRDRTWPPQWLPRPYSNLSPWQRAWTRGSTGGQCTITGVLPCGHLTWHSSTSGKFTLGNNFNTKTPSFCTNERIANLLEVVPLLTALTALLMSVATQGKNVCAPMILHYNSNKTGTVTSNQPHQHPPKARSPTPSTPPLLRRPSRKTKPPPPLCFV